jgi:hypothetical protein
MPQDFPYGVIIILGTGLVFVLYIIYYILKLANEEMKDGKMDSQRREVTSRQENT